MKIWLSLIFGLTLLLMKGVNPNIEMAKALVHTVNLYQI